MEEVADGLSRLIDQGKARYVGVSNFFKDDLQKLSNLGPLHSLQPQLNILKRRILENSTLKFCRDSEIAVLAWGPLCEGILSGRVTMNSEFGDWDNRYGHDEYEPADRRRANLKIVSVLSEIAGERDVSTAQVAIRWTLSLEGMTTALCGARNAGQIADSCAAADWELNREEFEQIEAAVRQFRPDLIEIDRNMIRL
jgi:aryl-alcohol dehydrogenase-like predicted oxidoreductase